MSSVDQASNFLADIQERHSESGKTPDSEVYLVISELIDICSTDFRISEHLNRAIIAYEKSQSSN